jgi:hypothetical protein
MLSQEVLSCFSPLQHVMTHEQLLLFSEVKSGTNSKTHFPRLVVVVVTK